MFCSTQKKLLARAACALVLGLACAGAHAQAQGPAHELNIPAGTLKTALDTYAAQTGLQLLYNPADIEGVASKGAHGMLTEQAALAAVLDNSGLQVQRDGSGAIVIFRGAVSGAPDAALATVTVTAQKRSQTAQSVPIAMTTLGAKAIEAYRVQSLQDVGRLTPGLLVSAFSSDNPTIAIRGISNTFSQIGVSKPVAVVVDDVFIPRNSAASFELFDLDSITVLKGPQGTLFGRNVTGGAIVITTRPPSLDGQVAETQLTMGNAGERQFNGTISGPMSEAAAFRLTMSLHDRGGFGTDRLTGNAQDDLHSRNLRGQLLLVPGSGIEATLRADYSEDWNGGRTLSSDTLGDDGNVRTSEVGVPQGFQRTIAGLSARVNWTLDAGQLTSVTAYRRSHSAEDYSGVGANFSFLETGSQSVVRDADQVGTFSQEVRYASPKWQHGDFVTGIYLLDEHGTRQLGTRGLAAKTGILASSILADQNVDTDSYAAFVDGVLHLPASVDLTAGVRYTRDEKTASLTRSDLVRPANTFSVRDVTHAWSEVTPRAVMSWQPLRNLMGYASVTRGFTAGGYNGDAATAAIFATPFAPEKVTSYEVGVKSQWLDNRLRANVSLYKMDYTDKQELVNNALTGVLSIVNASSATVKGGELELAYKPVPWLDLSTGFSRINGRYDSFIVGSINYTGNPLASAPPKQVSTAASLNLPIGAYGYLIGSANYAWRDSYNTGAANDVNLRIPGYGLSNFSLGVEAPGRAWRLTAWVKNANDTKYILTRSTQVVRAEYAGDPRTFGLTLGAKF